MENSILIKNVILGESARDVLILNNKIEKISELIDYAASKIIVGEGKHILPGFVNMHTHAAMTLMRGVGEDMALKEWLNERIWPIEAKLDEEIVYWGTKLACLEMIKSGTTTFNDHYFFIDSAAKASSEMMMRSVHSYLILDLHDSTKWDRIKAGCYNALGQSEKWGTREELAIGIHSPYSVSEEMLNWGVSFARDNGLLIHIHVSETEGENKESLKRHNLSPTAYLDKLGVLGPDVIAAHCLWMSDEDIEIFAKRDVKVVHNINSNLKIASGYQFRYNEFRDAGVTVTLGTDGCASSNNLDMIETMKTTALLQKGWRRDPTAMPLSELIDLSTLNGGKALRHNTGKIEEGFLADLILIDTESFAFTPNINFSANLIYSANSSCVDTVICNGNLLMEGRVVEGEKEIIENANRVYKKLIK